jgi:hypothetical protein
VSAYPQKIKIERGGAAGGSQNAETGAWTPAAVNPVVIYEGRCDAQDKGKVLTRDAAGNPMVTADISVFLPKRGAIGESDIRQDDTATITWEDGGTTVGQVLRADRLDDSLYLRRA